MLFFASLSLSLVPGAFFTFLQSSAGCAGESGCVFQSTELPGASNFSNRKPQTYLEGGTRSAAWRESGDFITKYSLRSAITQMLDRGVCRLGQSLTITLKLNRRRLPFQKYTCVTFSAKPAGGRGRASFQRRCSFFFSPPSNPVFTPAGRPSVHQSVRTFSSVPTSSSAISRAFGQS